MERKTLKLALEVLQFNGNIWHMDCKKDVAITAIKEALAQPEGCQCPACKVTPHASNCAVHSEPAYPKGACNCGAQPEQEPVFWYKPYPNGMYNGPIHNAQIGDVLRGSEEWIPLYTTPPQRKPLTDGQIVELCDGTLTTWEQVRIARAIEAAHGIGDKT